MLVHLLTRDSVHLLKESTSIQNALRFAIDELPAWRFTDYHRRGLLELSLQVPHDSWGKVSHGVLLLPVKFSGVKFPLLSVVICKNKIRSPFGVEDLSILIMFVMPAEAGEGLEESVQGSLRHLFKGRFLQERLRICSDRDEIMSVLDIEPNYQISAAG